MTDNLSFVHARMCNLQVYVSFRKNSIFIISMVLSVHVCIFYQVYVSLRNKSIFRLHPWLTVHMSLLKYCSERENVIYFLLFPPFLKILVFLSSGNLLWPTIPPTRLAPA